MSETLRGLVVGVGSRSVQVHVEGVGELRCTLRGNLWVEDPSGKAIKHTRPVAVGDRVELVRGDDESGVVESVDPRTTQLSRPVPHGGRLGRGRTRDRQSMPLQVIAANLDRLVIVAALLDPPFRPGLVDRFLVAAAMQGLDPLLVLNKVDLATEAGLSDDDLELLLEPWLAADIPVLLASADANRGIDELSAVLGEGISLLVGHSGVGKTSLLNAVSPGLKLGTGEVTRYHGRGRHTTTRVRLLRLDSGGWVVDSPGIREFALEDVPAAELARLFPGFGELPDACRFSNCLHLAEPGCAVRTAVVEGEFDEDRYEGYLKLTEG